jgi:hypothetical protein
MNAELIVGLSVQPFAGYAYWMVGAQLAVREIHGSIHLPDILHSPLSLLLSPTALTTTRRYFKTLSSPKLPAIAVTSIGTLPNFTGTIVIGKDIESRDLILTLLVVSLVIFPGRAAEQKPSSPLRYK